MCLQVCECFFNSVSGCCVFCIWMCVALTRFRPQRGDNLNELSVALQLSPDLCVINDFVDVCVCLGVGGCVACVCSGGCGRVWVCVCVYLKKKKTLTCPISQPRSLEAKERTKAGFLLCWEIQVKTQTDCWSELILLVKLIFYYYYFGRF